MFIYLILLWLIPSICFIIFFIVPLTDNKGILNLIKLCLFSLTISVILCSSFMYTGRQTGQSRDV